MSTAADFTTLPIGAMVDQRLSALDLRCLALIGWYDRRSLSRGAGRGCYASHANLAERLGVDITSFSRTLSRLAKLGYIVRERQQEDRRKQTIRVVYQPRDTCHGGQLSGAEGYGQILDGADNHSGEMVDGAVNEIGEILDVELSKTRGNLPKTASQETLLKRERDAVKQGRDSLERAQPLSAARRDDGLIDALFDESEQSDEDRREPEKRRAEAPAIQRVTLASLLPPSYGRLSDDAKISHLERALKGIGWETHRLPDHERLAVNQVLTEIAFDSDNRVHAERALRMLEHVEAAWAA